LGPGREQVKLVQWKLGGGNWDGKKARVGSQGDHVQKINQKKRSQRVRPNGSKVI